jgi:hypothetical protein
MGPTYQGDQMSLSSLMRRLNRGKKEPKNVDFFSKFRKTAESKQSPRGRKFAVAQSGY